MMLYGTFCFKFTVAHPNKNNNNKKMENSGISESAEDYLNNCLGFQQLSE